MNQASATPRYFIGLMSGTSVDGVDAALIDCSQNQIKLIDFIDHPLPASLTTDLIALNQTQELNLNTLCELEHQVAQQFIQATQTLLNKTQLSAKDITAIGSHGQTIFHAPNIPMSLQIGHPAFIAKQTGIDTVADFRIDDLAVGGQGAPLAPSFHQQLFTGSDVTYVINIGGIANVSYLNKQTNELFGFDTGPGNGLMDEICQQAFGQAYDKNGEIAASGSIHQALLKQLLAHPYFAQSFPKSTGRETFNQEWLKQQLDSIPQKISASDLMATLCELTARSIQVSIQKLAEQLNAPAGQVWIVGGGAYNSFLIQRIQQALPNYKVQSSSEADINPNAIEAMMCGWLAQQRIDNLPIPLTSITGSTRNVTLGGLWLAN
ncbi:MAG: anhydro-N-acetylmuramic acid kinase [Pseudomonadota bacterium]|nr:anhydro-N-acetylmuramic acid kinase [Pseudomonadota bacterium]